MIAWKFSKPSSLAGAAAAQEGKPFTLEELYSGAGPLLALPLPDIQGCADDSSYIEYRRSGPDSGKTLNVDAVTGSVCGYRPDPFARDDVRSLLPKGVTARSAAAADAARGVYVYLRENDLWVFDAKGPSWRRLTTSAADEKNPTLSPDRTRIAYTRENDLYVADVAAGTEVRITRDGSGTVYSGRGAILHQSEEVGVFRDNHSRKRAYFHRFPVISRGLHERIRIFLVEIKYLLPVIRVDRFLRLIPCVFHRLGYLVRIDRINLNVGRVKSDDDTTREQE